ncbi:hypothetical protein AYK26_07690 [Euryarchaeota archaeon SM23-78]|nr:MAG: hypothetical protein AYK26_07690 [Euryarchaeota archaeon SM23-78]
MADLIERLAFHDIDGRPKIPGHRFDAYFKLYASGKRSASELNTYLDLQGDEITQAQAVLTHYDGLTTNDAKLKYVLQVEGVCVLLNTRDPEYVIDQATKTIDKAKVQSDLDL